MLKTGFNIDFNKAFYCNFSSAQDFNLYDNHFKNVPTD